MYVRAPIPLCWQSQQSGPVRLQRQAQSEKFWVVTNGKFTVATNNDYREGHLFLRDSKTEPRTVWLSRPSRNVLDGLDRTGQWVFPAARGKGPRNKGWLEGFWDTVHAEAGLRGVRLHDLRHTHASIALRQGETVLTIARLLGHRTPETTLKYTHLADKTVMDAAETVGAALDA